MRHVLSTFMAAFLLLSAAPTYAQDEEPEAGTNAAQDLPDAAVLGSEWVLAEVISPDSIERYGFTMSPDVFREGAAGIYLGPAGSRALIVRFLLTDNRVAIRRSWDDAGELLHTLGYSMSTDYSRDQELETMAPPDGCLEAKRVEGVEKVFRLPAGATLCAGDDDSLFLVVIYGEVNGLTGVAASDAIATDILIP
jgi:hypothetical protein